MNKRIDLHNRLIQIHGNNVYYQPPENLKMEYPCIRYSKINLSTKKADNINYKIDNCYQIIIIDKKPDNPSINKILEDFSMSSYDRHYISDNLNHDVITLYY